ncbi:sulfite exporter TauE/SafE family protein 3-like [Triticum dicoccoides]|uniref:Uncharacterized protein n=1 Tax=Triticum turgidum subsp. durum TaxID=4567 RepID=A0A9R0VY42_TRITD|nr:sulfite exporter TauE/SafE family protein 3-like [Triticum dicoccoides]VAH89602.1 unnamed protein product [Triticum turgidum subsp. durum]
MVAHHFILSCMQNYVATCSTWYWVLTVLQVSSATGSFAMMFSSSMAAMEYYLLKRFPVPYALFFTSLTFVAAIVGQRVARKLVNWLGRASFIIFILSSMIFVSAISLGGVGISKTTHKMARHEYMGFGNICNYHA